LPLHSVWRPTATKWLRQWRFCNCCRSMAVSLLPTRCIATPRWRNTFSIAAPNMRWRSKRTSRRCLPTSAAGTDGGASASRASSYRYPWSRRTTAGDCRTGCSARPQTRLPRNQSSARVESPRRVGDIDDPPLVRYFLLSKPWSPARVLAITRAHWGIENGLHWVLDVVFDEDRARNRKDNGPKNLAILRKLALNILRSHPNKASIRRKIKQAGWDDAFLLSMLGQMR